MEETFDIFVGSLLSCVTQESLTSLFEKFGKIVKLRILERTPPKGMKFAFIHYALEAEALKAIENMNEFMYNGVPLQVRKSDRWLKRSGEEKVISKGNMGKKISGQKPSSSTTDNIGVWEPPRSDKSNIGTKSENSSVNSSAPGPKIQPTVTRTLKEKIAVTHVEDPVTFFGYFASKNSDLETLSRELQNICSTYSPICGEPKEKEVYASMYTLDRQWYRCRILEIDKSLKRSVVQYIDFGNVEKVSNDSLVDLPPRLKIIAPFTMECVLENLTPFPNNPGCYNEALDFFKSQVTDNIVSAVLHVKGNGNVLHVSEINLNGINIVEAMIKNNYLVHKFSVENNRNYTKPSTKAPATSPSSFQGVQNNKPKKSPLPETRAIAPNYNHVMFNQEKAKLVAENKKLKYEFCQAMGKNKALEMELHAVNRSIAEPNPYMEFPCVLQDIEKVRLLRQQFPVRPNSVDYIDKGVLLLRECESGSKPFDKQQREKIHTMVTQFYSLQEQILNCTDKDKVLELIKDRNSLQETVFEELTNFCVAIHSNEAQERLQSIQTVLAEIRNVYELFLRIQMFSETAMPIEELYNFYSTSKNEKKNEFLELQNKTNSAHRNFFRALQPASQNIDQRHVTCISIPELTNALAEMKTCLSEEIRVCTMEDTPEASILGVISHLLCDKLEMSLQSMEETRFLEKQYTALLEDLKLNTGHFPPPGLEQLIEKRKERKKLKSQLRHILADKMDLEENEEASDLETSKINQRLSEVRCELHRTFLEEDKMIAGIADLQEKVFPELNNLYPEFGFREYNKYKGIVKAGLEIEHFDLQPATASSSTSHYLSSFMDKTIRLQEYQLSSEEEKENLLSCVLQYCAVSHPNLLLVEAVFFTKKFVHAYVQQPLLSTLQSFVEENDHLHPERIITILWDILQGLSALHAHGIIHSSLHPTTVFISANNETIVDSVSFQPHKLSEFLPSVNGIYFQGFDTENILCCGHDFYSFAYLALWLIYPKTKFNLSASGTPILQDLPLDAFKVEILKLVNQIMETPASELQACNILNHPALTNIPENFQILEYPEVPDTDSDILNSEGTTTTDGQDVPAENCDNTELVEETEEPDFKAEMDESKSSEEGDNLEDYDYVRLNQYSLGISEAANDI